MWLARSPGDTGPSPRRGPAVDLDPTGIVTGKGADRQRRQFLNYSFYRLDPVFRRLPADERRATGDRVHRTGAAVGVFGRPDPPQTVAPGRLPVTGVQSAFAAALVSVRQQNEGAVEGLELLPGEGQYLFVYSFTKTRSWYRLSPQARQGMMDGHIAASAPFKGASLNSSYSYGIDDQDFVVAFDSDYPQEFADLVGRLPYTEASICTQRDTPMFTCAKAPIDAILAQLANMD